MTRRAAFIVVALVAAALVGVGLLAIPGSPFEQRPTLGLDLQGGLEVTLQAVPPRNRELKKEDLDRSVSIMRDRVDKLGVAEPEIRTQGDDQISIQLPGVKDPAPRRRSSARPRSSSSSTCSRTWSRRRSTSGRGSRSRHPSSTTSSPASNRWPRRESPTRTTSSRRRARSSCAAP